MLELNANVTWVTQGKEKTGEFVGYVEPMESIYNVIGRIDDISENVNFRRAVIRSNERGLTKFFTPAVSLLEKGISEYQIHKDLKFVDEVSNEIASIKDQLFKESRLLKGRESKVDLLREQLSVATAELSASKKNIDSLKLRLSGVMPRKPYGNSELPEWLTPFVSEMPFNYDEIFRLNPSLKKDNNLYSTISSLEKKGIIERSRLNGNPSFSFTPHYLQELKTA